jgi:hypothetical protein
MTIGWKPALTVWWSAAWRGGLYGALGGIVLGGIGGAVAGIAHAPENASLYGAIGGYVASIPASMLGLKQSLSKHLRSLAAIANDSAA